MSETPRPAGDQATASAVPGVRSPASHPQIGAYRLLQRLGEGGMGEVWSAEQIAPVRRQVALKIVKAGMDTEQVLARFAAERQALALMDHPAIARIYDGGTTEDGRPYFAMEYVRGEAITRYCDRNRLSVRVRLDLFIQLCEGVQHAHQKGIIHRDLKPSNVLVSDADGKLLPHIIDFGIAKAVGQPLIDQPLVTAIGGFVGTAEYMSPEQADMSSLDIDTRSDVYSLGVLLYELLTGALPYDTKLLRERGFDAVRRAIREADPPKPSTRISRSEYDVPAELRGTQKSRLVSQLRGDLDWIVLRALEKDRNRRYQTVNALSLDVRRHLNLEPVAAGPPSTAYRAGKFVRRHRLGVAVAATLVALLLVFAGVTAVQAARIARERDRANQEAVLAKLTSDFLVGLFRASAPSEARGRTLTAREILDAGARRIDELHDQPDLKARLQATIGNVYTELGSYSAALPLVEGSLNTHRARLGADHRDTLAVMNDLANLYWYQDRLNEAEALYLEVIAGRQRVLGPEHPDTLRATFDLGSLYFRQKKHALAEQVTRQTMETQRRVLGRDHQDTVATESSLAAVLSAMGRYQESSEILERVVAVRRRLLGPDHPSTATSLGNLGFSYLGLKDYQRAESTYLESIEISHRVNGDLHQRTAAQRRRLAEIYLAQKRYADAEPIALKTYEGYLSSLGAENDNTVNAVKWLIAFYEEWGKPAEAARWKARQ